MTQKITKRTQGRYKADLKLRDSYKFYIASLVKSEIKDGYKVSYREYVKAFKKAFSIISDLVLDNNEIILPARCGTLRIKKRKESIYPVDWKATNELREKDIDAREKKIKIRHLNEHTDGSVYKWHWGKFTSNIKNKTAYSFISTRTNNRKLNAILQQEDRKIDYYG